MEDEPEVEQPDRVDIHQQQQQQLLLDDEEDELADEDMEDDDDEDAETDISQLHDESIREALSAVVKEEIFGHDQPLAKKSEFYSLINIKIKTISLVFKFKII